MFSNLLNLSVLALLPLTAFAGHGNPLLNRHHQDLAKRQPGHVEVYERGPGSRWSFYNVETGNAGSCGQFHTNDQFTVAMNAAQMNSGWCFKTITMTYNGKSTTATISDTCPGCPYNGLDLTEGLFQFFAPASVGIIYGDWEFTDAAPAPAPKPDPTPTPQPKPKPTSTWVPPPPPKTTKTTTWTPDPTPTTTKTTVKPTPTETPTTWSKASSTKPWSSAQPTSSNAPSSSINYSSGAASGLAVPTGSFNSPQNQSSNIADMNNFFVQMGGVIAAGSKV